MDFVYLKALSIDLILPFCQKKRLLVLQLIMNSTLISTCAFAQRHTIHAKFLQCHAIYIGIRFILMSHNKYKHLRCCTIFTNNLSSRAFPYVVGKSHGNEVVSTNCLKQHENVNFTRYVMFPTLCVTQYKCTVIQHQFP